MSIILKGIDLPKICELCPFWVMRTDGRWCRTLHKIIDISKDRADDCPLVEIPTPHGRLIDGDEIEAEAEQTLYGEVSYEDIANAPTILEAEE